MQFHDLYGGLIADDERNRVICGEVVEAVQDGRSPIVLTERNAHLDALSRQLEPSIQHLVVLRGGMSAKELASVPDRLAAIPRNESRVLLATGRFMEKGSTMRDPTRCS